MKWTLELQKEYQYRYQSYIDVRRQSLIMEYGTMKAVTTEQFHRECIEPARQLIEDEIRSVGLSVYHFWYPQYIENYQPTRQL